MPRIFSAATFGKRLARTEIKPSLKKHKMVHNEVMKDSVHVVLKRSRNYLNIRSSVPRREIVLQRDLRLV